MDAMAQKVNKECVNKNTKKANKTKGRTSGA